MATESYTIYSHYDSRENQENQSSSKDAPEDENTWQFDPSFRLRSAAPRFVPATLSIDQLHLEFTASESDSVAESLGTNVSNWYRALQRHELDGMSDVRLKHESQASTSMTDPRPPCSDKLNKNNWFISKAIQSQPPMSTLPSLAEIIARDPPPLPAEPKYHPPVWLEIGPSNKGFEMLQRHGWNEGEPLGPDVQRRSRSSASPLRHVALFEEQRQKNGSVKQIVRELRVEGHDDVSELKKVEVIDLTESDPGYEDAVLPPTPSHVNDEDSGEDSAFPQNSSYYTRTALVTPIRTVLKADRLGIGLKAKTVGPYKAPKKRVTHNAAALAAHIKAANDLKKRKKELSRGRRSHAKQHKREGSS